MLTRVTGGGGALKAVFGSLMGVILGFLRQMEANLIGKIAAEETKSSLQTNGHVMKYKSVSFVFKTLTAC